MYQTSRTRGNDWSGWIYHPDYKEYYRQRQDSSGNPIYQWQSEYEREAVQVPRTPVEQITQQFETVNLQSPEQTAGEEQNYDEYFVEGGTSSRSKPKTSSSRKSRPSKHSSKKGKAVALDETVENEEQNDEDYYTKHRTAAEPAQDTYYFDPETGQYFRYQQSGQDSSEHYADDSAEKEDEELLAAIAQSKYYNRDQYQSGESSDAYAAYAAYELQDEGKDPEPSAPAGNSDHIIGTGGDAETLDPRYRVAPSQAFQPGEVFKVLWPEPVGGAGRASSIAEESVHQDQYGGRIFVHFRRFIIVANDLGHCTCIPISTYGRKGCRKSGVKAEQHGIVTESSNRKPTALAGEPKLGFPAIRVHISEPGERISKESRVNYSKLTTVEHNVKVFFIGRVVGSDWDIVTEAVNTSWANKMHRKKHRS
ncbi:hypothetical protein NW762_006766 [Fusarium torreyae]|uniref:DUF6590 domain-containing protein n=1 Tax=Fusarium torreyae TaxID=1237075 RepID=A0A9W8RZM0_9HYPO|nr:hypothetical protein NW762_006766 [Fusarium torreyae]